MTREHNERITAAYYAATIPLMKKIPKLEKLLVSDEPKKVRRQSVDEQIAIAMQWTAATSR
jgi:hypothetical protein